MTTVKEIGSLCVTDRDGCIINHSDMNKINPIFLPVIYDVVNTYSTHLQDNLHSVYIRGSIPKGIGIEGVADLDTIAVTKQNLNKQQLKLIKDVGQELNQKHTCVDGIELSFYCIEDVLNTSFFSIISFILQTHGMCVFGEDLIPQLPRYKANEALANDHLIHLQAQIENACDDLQDNSDIEDIKDCCKWIMKIIVRAGLALVITKANTYTRDLYPAYKLFSKYFPEKENDMRKALEYAITPIIDTNLLLSFLNEFGKWMVSEVDKWLQFYNPNRELHMKI
ncbi:nucleotidyltransferase [Bacillus anthracis]|nr:nucleotidyltransferase [Bacillus anthracis]PFA45043.1 nucleotidyltransferase [Bacillus anthracis]PFF12201.1 nucleotidyltransferase [Bacillus anthracis]